MIFTLA